jgi:transcriptional regulator with XRE-family HTH domain
MPPKKSAANIALGNAIRAARRERGYTQESFAAHADIDRSYYGAIERGGRARYHGSGAIRARQPVEADLGRRAGYGDRHAVEREMETRVPRRASLLKP